MKINKKFNQALIVPIIYGFGAVQWTILAAMKYIRTDSFKSSLSAFLFAFFWMVCAALQVIVYRKNKKKEISEGLDNENIL